MTRVSISCWKAVNRFYGRSRAPERPVRRLAAQVPISIMDLFALALQFEPFLLSLALDFAKTVNKFTDALNRFTADPQDNVSPAISICLKLDILALKFLVLSLELLAARREGGRRLRRLLANALVDPVRDILWRLVGRRAAFLEVSGLVRIGLKVADVD